MSKNLKDIFETGRKRLNDLAEKRKELVERCVSLKNGAGLQRLDDTSRRLTSLETSTMAEITAQLDAAGSMQQQSLTQILEDNDRHLSEIKTELEFRVSRMSKELACLQQWYLDLSTDKADQQLRPLEQKYRSVVAQYNKAVFEHLNDLDTAARKAHSLLVEERDHLAGEATINIKEAKDKLTAVIDEVSKKLQITCEELEDGMNSEIDIQTQTLVSVTRACEENITSIRTQKSEEIASLCRQVESELHGVCEQTVSDTASRMTQLASECGSELETGYQFSNDELSQTLEQLRLQTNEASEALKKTLDEAERNTRSKAEEAEQNAMRNFEEAMQARSLELSSDSARVMLEEMIADLKKMSGQLTKQLNNSMQLHKERFSTLIATSEKTLSVSLDSLKFDLDRMVEMQKVAYKEKEQLLNSRLDTLERQYTRIMAGISDDM